MHFISDYIKVFKAEWLKLKNSGITWLIIGMSAFIPVIFTIAGLVQSESEITTIETENSWKLIIENCFTGFGIFFFPIFLTLIVVRLTQMEHRGGGWKLIETQPISKLSLFLGKYSVAVVISLFCILSLILFALLSGLIIMIAKPGSGFSRFSVPFGYIFGLGFRLLISGLGILGIQYLFSIIISGFLLPFSIGLISTIAGSILFGFGKALWWPYTAPALTVTNPGGSQSGNFLMFYEWLSIGWMLLALWLGYQWYHRKKFKRAYFRPITRSFHVIIPVALFTLFFIYINRPVQLHQHSRTVLAGVFDTKETIHTAYVLAEPMLDTVLVIPVKNNKFHFTTDKKISANQYLFLGEKQNPQPIFFGSNDSLFIKMKEVNRSSRMALTGNRIAENEYLKKGKQDGGYAFYYLENFGHEMKPSGFSRELIRLWKNDIEKIDNYKTSDNLKPAPDFITLQKKLTSLRYLNLLENRYVKRYTVYHPNEKPEFPKSIDDLKKAASYDDSTLLSNEEFRNIITDYYQQHYKLSLSNDTSYISKLCQVQSPGRVRDFLVYNKLKEVIGKTSDSIRREKLLDEFMPLLLQQRLQHQLLAQHALLKSLNRGKPAPDFTSYALSKDTFSLAEFKGRYVVIDVWATWCGPCRVQSPSFERIAELYTSPLVAFVAVSVDQDTWAWKYEAAEKSVRVLQLITDNKDEFGKLYGIEYIPRFMLLGPDGKIINAQMPEPSNPLFEEILKQEIPGLKSL